MARLTRYFLWLFSLEALSLFGVAAFLLFLIQCLRLIDVVSTKGQSLVTMLGQAMLGMPSLGLVFLYVCMGIGLGRALRNLQGNSELQIVHAGGLVPVLLRAVALYSLAGALLALLLAHVVEPVSKRANNEWAASIAADLVSRSMIPHKFTELVSGVSLVIGARDSQGNIADFFADDTRDAATRRTYFAKSAVITRDEEGYVLRMQKGAVQYLSATEGMSEIAFDRYDLPLDSLAGTQEVSDSVAQTSSLDLVSQQLAAGQWDADIVQTLIRRSADGLRVLAMGLFITALAAFPTGARRRFEVPIELVVLAAAFGERAISSFVPGAGWLQLGTGAIILFVAGLVILAVRLRVFRPVRVARMAI